nr:hypothetical protein [Tanacetum cinerariifolium]
MTTLAEFMIIVGADNRPPMLEKSLYDSWKSQDGTTMTKKYEELSVAEKLQADCDLKATNIVLQGLPPDVVAVEMVVVVVTAAVGYEAGGEGKRGDDGMTR